MSGICCFILSLFQSTFSFLWHLFNPLHLPSQHPVANGFTYVLTIHIFLWIQWKKLLVLRSLCCCMALNTYWQRCHSVKGSKGKGNIFVLCYPLINRMVVTYPREICDHPVVRPQWGQRFMWLGHWHSCGSKVEPVMDDMPEWATPPSKATVLTGSALASHIQHQ